MVRTLITMWWCGIYNITKHTLQNENEIDFSAEIDSFLNTLTIEHVFLKTIRVTIGVLRTQSNYDETGFF